MSVHTILYVSLFLNLAPSGIRVYLYGQQVTPYTLPPLIKSGPTRQVPKIVPTSTYLFLHLHFPNCHQVSMYAPACHRIGSLVLFPSRRLRIPTERVSILDQALAYMIPYTNPYSSPKSFFETGTCTSERTPFTYVFVGL